VKLDGMKQAEPTLLALALDLGLGLSSFGLLRHLECGAVQRVLLVVDVV